MQFVRRLALSFVLSSTIGGCVLFGFDDNLDADFGDDDDASIGGDGDGVADGDGDDGALPDASTGDGDAMDDLDAGDDDAGTDGDAAMPCDLSDPDCDVCEPDSVTCIDGMAVHCNERGKVEARKDCGARVDDCQVGHCTNDVGCTMEAQPDGTTCNEGRFCTGAGACKRGVCGGIDTRDCRVFDGPCTVGRCSEDLGKCQAEPHNQGMSCGNRSTCNDGLCTGGCEGADCAPSCDADVSGCKLDCAATANCTPLCKSGGTCALDCTSVGGEGCKAKCESDSTCQVDCSGASACIVECPDGASCTLDCTGVAGECGFSVCDGGATTCSDGTIACGTDCPG